LKFILATLHAGPAWRGWQDPSPCRPTALGSSCQPKKSQTSLRTPSRPRASTSVPAPFTRVILVHSRARHLGTFNACPPSSAACPPRAFPSYLQCKTSWPNWMIEGCTACAQRIQSNHMHTRCPRRSSPKRLGTTGFGAKPVRRNECHVAAGNLRRTDFSSLSEPSP